MTISFIFDRVSLLSQNASDLPSPFFQLQKEFT